MEPEESEWQKRVQKMRELLERQRADCAELARATMRAVEEQRTDLESVMRYDESVMRAMESVSADMRGDDYKTVRAFLDDWLASTEHFLDGIRVDTRYKDATSAHLAERTRVRDGVTRQLQVALAARRAEAWRLLPGDVPD